MHAKTYIVLQSPPPTSSLWLNWLLQAQMKLPCEQDSRRPACKSFQLNSGEWIGSDEPKGFIY